MITGNDVLSVVFTPDLIDLKLIPVGMMTKLIGITLKSIGNVAIPTYFTPKLCGNTFKKVVFMLNLTDLDFNIVDMNIKSINTASMITDLIAKLFVSAFK
ncbi:hypothetical protein H8S90_24760 [Olivibacter sp. SDN3]|uniref:hypothetical protein n=1 Tax=Olivibacter sp. SDN3 TaxID=2764720 RepID=UPI00165194B2|nr:hypothetical protein [Olivibacter sp. SDN3]QNL49869.1 hypothetical protein H8S90_24760 [Olivibacter sp. SDN3]